MLNGVTRCPRCGTHIDLEPDIVCSGCGHHYPQLGAIPILLRDPETYLRSCRAQLGLLEQQTDRTIQSIEQQLHAADVLDTTKARCRALIQAVREQANEIRAILEPVTGAPNAAASGDVPAPLQYIHYLYRDWGWPWSPDGENERILSLVDAVKAKQSLGRTLVLGAGACRLAYDLHRRDSTAETTVLDIEPFLFTCAHTLIRGGSLTIHEANAEVQETEHAATVWNLRAPHGAIAEDRFHFVIADGLEPPFAPEAFDTIVTPWFIDVVPPDLRDVISSIHRLLRPGGRWINVGPLVYRPAVSVVHRFSREELFDLAVHAGFHIDDWRSESMPYLVSKLNGRGKVEWVLAFAATKTDAGSDEWLLFRHLPIPTFPGQSMFSSDDPAIQMVVSAIDGRRTLDDIARLIAAQASETGLTISQFREIVRRCLAEAHPACARR
jgi:SAM-dependent methyltransferase